MIQLVVVAHGKFASGILASLKLIAGQVEKIQTVDFTDGMSAQEVKERIKSVISSEEKVLVLTDLLGGTPFKVSVELVTEHSEKSIAVLSGLNLAMLLEANFSRLTDDLEPLVSKLVNVAREGVADSITLLKQDNGTEEELFEDGI
ncbi:PTS sugar transporter subunit IIA [Streptococcus ruminantium]|uniref:PTS sugar transporter subunit IIA n=1 Tax=Streptococcus ruminantium TaxID=1917441 RepID=A0ABU1B133_9STRE|nr:PTS sugar transporter subunit IIA [Streptococcus ruminantium]MDQ8758938.1 PTS sugar transporter subunit IIA [Streptococcus ruminantium]MDQ8769567.1 PTS sugar transporter subunit IIA [Streptococcus ruminantium]MDQ8774239.1 PTS sugar transporter subunit IIA [Streptococcus ruminantium]MDQ8794043.1 PTS sugar transporter subunit IIA [Streptococcus ruminantium]MDQ8795422.1 PTS sugar transporter subunit IIA [Streptococcus ruminantium]